MNQSNNNIANTACQDNFILPIKKSINDIIADFTSCASVDFVELPVHINTDGDIHRFADKSRRDHNPNGFYLLNVNCPVPWGLYGNWSTSGFGYLSKTWFDSSINALGHEDRKKLIAIAEASRKERIRELMRERKEAEENAAKAWELCLRVDKDMKHGYLEKKKISACGAKIFYQDTSKLVIPIYNSKKKIISLQFIDQEGNKRFLKGTSPKFGFFMINEYSKGAICICEGYATGASIYEATGYRVVVSFSAENLVNIAKIIKNIYKNDDIIICADNDAYSSCNIGMEKASQASKDIGALVVFPKFKNVSTSPSDFNDLFVLEGIEAVKKIFAEISIIKHECLHEFLERKFCKATPILYPWLAAGTLNMLYSKPGCGKSLLSLCISYAIASGKGILELGWECKKQEPVLYFDGELQAEAIQNDLRCIANNDVSYFVGRNLIISTLDDAENANIDLGVALWQGRIDDIIKIRSPKLVIIDNILSFVRSGKTNDVDFWNRITDWTKRHTNKGIAFLFIHHESKHGNASFGTSAIERSMSTIISLYSMSGYMAEKEAEEEKEELPEDVVQVKFVMECKKNRYFGIDKFIPVTVNIRSSFSEYKTVISVEKYEKTLKQKIIDLFNSRPINFKEIQNELLQQGRSSPPSSPYISKVLHEAYKNNLITRDLMPWEKIKF